jgi:hypothetical protein
VGQVKASPFYSREIFFENGTAHLYIIQKQFIEGRTKLKIHFIHHFNFPTAIKIHFVNGKEATVNKALDGSMYPG